MGHDEHGPAYPEHIPENVKPFHDLINRAVPPYRCPICRGNENRYLECEYPGCPDGRDQKHFERRYEQPPPSPRGPGSRIFLAVLVTTLFWLFASSLIVATVLWVHGH